ncbi:yeti [Lycorma delicatula]|uniref:yeti n=1 Tax=Lycorma delicatula TaxID=130591 RepID=UPI003F51AC16
MNEPDLPSDSDASDEDYRPSGEESGPASEEESGPEDVEDSVDVQEDDDGGNDQRKSKKENGKKLKKPKRKAEKRKAPVEESPEEKIEHKIVNTEEDKKRKDALWADFLKDCGGAAKKKPAIMDKNSDNSPNTGDKTDQNSKQSAVPEVNENTKVEEKENKSTVTQIFEFAGEEIRVERQVSPESVTSDSSNTSGTSPTPVPGRGRGIASRGTGRGGSALSSFLGQLGKKGKLSTLEKSKLDWDNFKKNEGIEEDLQKHNKGKDGYLEKQDFLERTDLRRFEIEKAFRQKRGGR